MNTSKSQQRTRRHARIRAKVVGTAERPRLSVFKSNRYVYAQLIDDTSATTLASESSLSQVAKKDGRGMKEAAREIGKNIAKKATEKGVSQVVFDRGGFIYTGVIREVAEGARESGLKL